MVIWAYIDVVHAPTGRRTAPIVFNALATHIVVIVRVRGRSLPYVWGLVTSALTNGTDCHRLLNHQMPARSNRTTTAATAPLGRHWQPR